MPFVPIGLITYIIAKKKIPYPKYLLITTLGLLPVLCVSFLFVHILITQSGSLLASMILAGTIIFVIVLISLLRKPISKLIDKFFSKYTLKYCQNNIKNPNKFILCFSLFLMRIFYYPKYNIHTNRKSFKFPKEPTIYISNHPSFLDILFIGNYTRLTRFNVPTAYYWFCNPKLAYLFHTLGAFPKYLFQADPGSMRNILRTIKNGNSLFLSVEGRLSPSGSFQTIVEGTEKLIKMLNIPVVSIKIEGAYLTYPKWAKSFRKGRVDVTFTKVYEKGEAKDKTIEEIHDTIIQHLDYNDFHYQKNMNIMYKSKTIAQGVENVLYICPICKSEFTINTNQDLIKCENCSMEVILTPKYEFITNSNLELNNIDEWYKMQIATETNNIEDESYQFSINCELNFPAFGKEKFRKAGDGIVTLSKEGLIYNGTVDNEEKIVFFPLHTIPAIPFGAGENFEVYSNDTLYSFIPNNLKACSKVSIICEALHTKYIKK